MAKETKVFQAEVSEILDLMIHSLYSQKEIFLRELISNASDAIDKLRIESLTNTNLKDLKSDPLIRIEPNKKDNTLTIIDNGIGMSYDEVLQNIGTIAHSGTKNFIKQIKEAQNNPELIGQFGVGFYSVFMVAEKVSLYTRKAGEKETTLWESTGTGDYSVETLETNSEHGTKIILTLKKNEKTETDFTDEWTIKSTVSKYSDFISHPIKMRVSKEEPELDKDGKAIEGQSKTVIEDQFLNSMKALWLKSPKEVKDVEYTEFYKQVFQDWNDPLKTIHYRAEGTQEFSSLMFIPKNKPMDWGYPNAKAGLNLYVKRIFIMDNCEDLLPSYLRFVKGLVDSSDLSLNVSREILQQDRQIAMIRKALAKKVLSSLSDMLMNDRKTYESMWLNFGPVLKEGIANDPTGKDKITEITLFRTTFSENFTTLNEYVGRMKKDQKDIYFLTGDNMDQLVKSPYLETLKAKGYEVLFMTDAVDEWVVQAISKWDGKDVINIASEKFNLTNEDVAEENKTEVTEKYKSLASIMQKSLDENIKEVKISNRLVDTPVCLVSGAYDQSSRMEKIMEAMGQSMPKSKRILEINPKHPVFEKMLSFDNEKQGQWAEILYNQALLNEGSQIDDPLKLSQQISELMMRA